jgi:hypothetical protein
MSNGEEISDDDEEDMGYAPIMMQEIETNNQFGLAANDGIQLFDTDTPLHPGIFVAVPELTFHQALNALVIDDDNQYDEIADPIVNDLLVWCGYMVLFVCIPATYFLPWMITALLIVLGVGCFKAAAPAATRLSSLDVAFVRLPQVGHTLTRTVKKVLAVYAIVMAASFALQANLPILTKGMHQFESLSLWMNTLEDHSTVIAKTNALKLENAALSKTVAQQASTIEELEQQMGLQQEKEKEMEQGKEDAKCTCNYDDVIVTVVSSALEAADVDGSKDLQVNELKCFFQGMDVEPNIDPFDGECDVDGNGGLEVKELLGCRVLNGYIAQYFQFKHDHAVNGIQQCVGNGRGEEK